MAMRGEKLELLVNKAENLATTVSVWNFITNTYLLIRI